MEAKDDGDGGSVGVDFFEDGDSEWRRVEAHLDSRFLVVAVDAVVWCESVVVFLLLLLLGVLVAVFAAVVVPCFSLS